MHQSECWGREREEEAGREGGREGGSREKYREKLKYRWGRRVEGKAESGKPR